MRCDRLLSASLFLAASISVRLRLLRATDSWPNSSLCNIDWWAVGRNRYYASLPALARLLGVWFFAILAPSSSVVPLFQQIAAEKRMYLPLAAVVICVVVGGYLAGRWLVRRGTISLGMSHIVANFLVVFLAITCGILTFLRNRDYQSQLSIWQDTIAKVPQNSRVTLRLA